MGRALLVTLLWALFCLACGTVFSAVGAGTLGAGWVAGCTAFAAACTCPMLLYARPR